MNKDLFWQIIEQAGISKGNSIGEGIRLIQGTLEQYPVEDIVKFQILFDAYKEAADYELIMGLASILMGCTSYDECVDVFDYFLDVIVFYGKECYLKTLEDPDSFVEVLTAEEQEEYDVEALNCLAYAPFVTKCPEREFRGKYESLILNDLEKRQLLKEIVYSPHISKNWDEVDELEDVLPHLFQVIDGEE